MSDWTIQPYTFKVIINPPSGGILGIIGEAREKIAEESFPKGGETINGFSFSYGGQVQIAIGPGGRFMTADYSNESYGLPLLKSINQDGSGIPSGGLGTVNGYADWDDTWKFQTTTDNYFLFTCNGQVMAFIDSTGQIWASVQGSNGKPGTSAGPNVITPETASEFSVTDETGLLIKTEIITGTGGTKIKEETLVALGSNTSTPSTPNAGQFWHYNTIHVSSKNDFIAPGYLTLETADSTVPSSVGTLKYSRSFGSSNWVMGYGQNDWLGFTYNGTLMMAITTDGRIWGKAIGGYAALFTGTGD